MECRYHGSNCPIECSFWRWTRSMPSNSDGSKRCEYHGNSCPPECRVGYWYKTGVPKKEIKIGGVTYVPKKS